MPKVSKPLRGTGIVESKAKGLKKRPKPMSKPAKAMKVRKPFMDGKVVNSGS